MFICMDLSFRKTIILNHATMSNKNFDAVLKRNAGGGAYKEINMDIKEI